MKQEDDAPWFKIRREAAAGRLFWESEVRIISDSPSGIAMRQWFLEQLQLLMWNRPIYSCPL